MNAIFLTFWGKKYSDDFLKLFLPCFAENLKNIKRDKKNFTLEIWTLLKDKNYIKKNSLFKKVNKKIKCNFKNIDFIINEGKINNMSKYELHETVSYIFKTSQYFKYQYFWFFYPDQFFSNKLILNVSNKTIKENADLVMMPSLNCNYKKICELLKKKKIFSYDFKKIYLDNLDISNEYVKIENIDKFQYLKVIDILKDSLIIQSFHTHPLVFKTKNNFEGFRYPFYPSLDEGISSFFAKKNTYLINSFNLGILGGTIDFFQKPKEYNNSLKSSIISGLLQFNDCHLKFSKEMFVYKLKNDRNLKERIKKVNKKISQLREGYEYLKKNLFHYPNSKENNLFKLKDYESIIELLFKMETKIKKYKNLKLIKYNKIIFEYLLKLSQSKIHRRKIHQNVFVKNILRSENKIYNKYINYLDEIYF